MSTTSITIRIPDDMLEQARTTAYDERSSVTELLIAGLRMELDRRARKGIYIAVPSDATISITAVGGSGDGAPGAVRIDIAGASLPSIQGGGAAGSARFGGSGGGGTATRIVQG